ncbi:hypothetical protein BHM03_00011341 [Ensete ventricosum]|nr:hypothetical protein BHM03_00011341 [Ensete ventricosum]
MTQCRVRPDPRTHHTPLTSRFGYDPAEPNRDLIERFNKITLPMRRIKCRSRLGASAVSHVTPSRAEPNRN